MLAAVRDGCWGGAVSLLTHTLRVDTRNPPYKQALIDAGAGTVFVICLRSTRRAEARRHGVGAGCPSQLPGVVVS
jgi:hypothetical protein